MNLIGGGTALSIGSTFTWSMDNGGVDDSGSSVGLSLRNGNANGDAADGTIFSGRRFGFEFQQGNANYKIVDSTGIVDTGIGFRRTGLLLRFTLTSLNAYSLSVLDVNSGNSVGLFTGNLAGASNAAISSLAMYNRFAGGGSERNVYFNSFSVSAVPEASAFAAGGVVCCLVGLTYGVQRLRRKRSAAFNIAMENYGRLAQHHARSAAGN